ncbi:PHP domain-containing protein [Aureliella helgolandensis]|uniref:PHP domain protein n=1 Tax=Aureliella helgolandensis TaxID=2527968 RepID=A0A518G614_9BACT|nr:hypothetical protein [Aureliella helgolandensis]QDV24036.1 hypothetical protein Q31a_23490 [Aureliella helgolandensis]
MDFSCPHTCMEPTNIPQWQGCGFDLEFSATRLPFPPFKKALMRSLSLTVFTLVLAAVLNLASSPLTNAQTPPDDSPKMQWWKGNLHTHSLWSDGDDFPEMIAGWYLDQEYNFLALSDHNIIQDGQRWMALQSILKRAEPDVLEKYQARFGDDWVETRGEGDKLEVRLKPLDEFAPLLQQANQFLLIPAEEISDSAEGKPVHMNATNLREIIQPLGGATVREVMQNNLRSVLEQEKSTGRQLLPHLNHPNFHYAVTAEDLAHVIHEQFFEIYNGHPGVNQLGDHEHISIEHMWDVANAIRLAVLDAEPLLGIATDDSHEYHGKPGARPGRGWVMVQSPFLTPEYLILAMKSANFYASSGVTLGAVDFDAESRTLSLDIQGAPEATFETQFIATLKSDKPGELPTADAIGKVVQRTSGRHPSYQMTGNELYVRALVTSSIAHTDPSIADQKQQAWTQPVGWEKP